MSLGLVTVYWRNKYALEHALEVGNGKSSPNAAFGDSRVWKKCNVFNGVEQTEYSINFAVISSRVQMKYPYFP